MERSLARSSSLACLVLLAAGCVGEDPPLALEVWHGERQRVGHLGDAQSDFNLLGTASARRLEYSLNDAPPRRLSLGKGEHGFRRLAGPGHFNADIAVAELAPGLNVVRIVARNRAGDVLERSILVERASGSSPLPYRIDWSEVRDPQDVGQYVDGRWSLGPDGLRTAQAGYDRIFLVGDRTWRDYEVRTSVTIHAVAPETGPVSGGNGLGIVLRFTGHVVGGPLDFPSAQPKWGYLPFGCIAWLRWQKGAPDTAPSVQHYRGDRNELTTFAPFEARAGGTYALAARCETQPDGPAGEGRTRYRFKVWPAEEPEPAEFAFDVTQSSADALRTGGLALLAHHVDASFGDVDVRRL